MGLAPETQRLPQAQCPLKLQGSGYWHPVFSKLASVVVEMHSIEERIKELTARATTADDFEVPALFVELQALLAEHSESVRYLAAKTLARLDQEPPSSKTAA